MYAARLALLLTLLCLLPCLGHAEYNATTALRAQYYNIASYCDAAKIHEWNCGAACDFNPRFDTSSVLSIDLLEIKAFVGMDNDAQQIVLSFSGCDVLTGFFEKLKFLTESYSNHNCVGDCHASSLLHGPLGAFQDTAVEKVMSLVTKNPHFSILVTGHSIGGALATLAAVALSVAISKLFSIDYKDVPLDLYTFGSPRIGNRAMIQWADSVLPPGRHFRVVHSHDAIPHFPPSALGFIHLPSEVWYTTYSDSNYTLCSDSADAEASECSNSLWYPMSFEDHVTYFGVDARCTPTHVSSRRQSRYLTAKYDAQRQGRNLTLSQQ